MTKLSDFSPTDKAYIIRVSRALAVAFGKSGLTQQQFADKHGENRTTISHFINCTRQATTNPVFKSMTILKRVAAISSVRAEMPATKKQAKIPEVPMEDKREENKAFDSILGGLRRFIRLEVRREVKAEVEKYKAAKKAQLGKDYGKQPPATGKSKKAAKKKISKKPARGQHWVAKDPRRQGALVEIVAVHVSGNPNSSRVTAKSLKTSRQSVSRHDEFIKRYSFYRGTH